jgi:limonene-1,2-epoxide hydrolase
VEVDVRHLLCEGAVVMTERVDYLRVGEKTATLRVAGVLEVHDGVISSWRDYFDLNEFASQISIG